MLAGVLLSMFLLPSLFSTDDRTEIPYSELRSKVVEDQVEEITWSNDGGSITGTLTDGTEFSSNGPNEPPEEDLALFREHEVNVEFSNPQPSILDALLPLLIPIALFIGIFWLLQRRAQSQMGGIMSIGRSKAKTYSTERPGTTFADVAGYEGVKQEIKEVVDFLREPDLGFAQAAREYGLQPEDVRALVAAGIAWTVTPPGDPRPRVRATIPR